MRAVTQRACGSSDVLAVTTVDRPAIAGDEVLIEVVAAGLDRGVWHLMAGQPCVIRVMGFGLTRPKNPVLVGHDRAAGAEHRRPPRAGPARAGDRRLRGVGSFTVQLAKALGARVTGVASTGKLDAVRSLGADHVIDYTQQAIDDGDQRYDLIIDTGGRNPLSRLRRALTPTGTLVIVGGEGGDRLTGGIGRQRAPPCCRRSSASG
jgi:NADPH:quinone reductase-like Zn-dependent oxidoreductase